MIEWAKAGRGILAEQKNLAPIERALLEAQVHTAELTGAALLTPSVDSIYEESFTPEKLQAEIEKQAKKYQELEFHKHKSTKMSAGRLKDLVMGLIIPQPETFTGRFGIPVVVFGQISPKDQAELLGLNYYLGGLKISDWPDDPRGYTTPVNPYMTWMQDGKKNLKKSVSTVRANLQEDERGATIHDGIALYIANPNVLKDHFIDLPGTKVESDFAPDLYVWHDRPRLHYDRVGGAYPGFGAASCGRV